jgi:MSHA pilin protein MshC
MSGRRNAVRGFSLTELVVVISIAVILSAVAISRINTKSFDAEGFGNQLSATLRYAQKVAIAQRRDVAVAISSSTVSLTYPGLAGTPALRKPPGTDAYTLAVPSGVTLGGTGAFASLPGATVTITVSALGKPSAGGTITVAGGDIAGITIYVEAETGYVH